MKIPMKMALRQIALGQAGTLLVMVCATMPVWAADDNAPDPTTTPVGTVFRWVNFLLVAGAIAYAIAKFGGAYFRGQAKEISQAIHEAADAKAAAERQAAEAEQRLARLPQEIEEMRQSARKESVAESERIRAMTRAEAEKIQKAAQAEIAAAERAGQQELRSIAARMATERAAAMLGQRMNDAARATLFQTFVGKLESVS